MRLFIFGYGFSARALSARLRPQGWEIAASVREPARMEGQMRAEGVTPVAAADPDALAAALVTADAVLVTAPPTARGCPGLSALAPVIGGPKWIGYLSTTGVYGDRQGGWVSETSALAARSIEGARRVGAERDWGLFGRDRRLAVSIFRLPGIYGPGRSSLDRLRTGQARRIVSPGQVFSRLHVDDLAAGLEASIALPRPDAIYNLCDDQPAANSEVIAYAAGLLGMAPPPEVSLEDAGLTGPARRFYAESKRVSNARAKAELGWRPAYPTYREGLAAVLAAGG